MSSAKESQEMAVGSAKQNICFTRLVTTTTPWQVLNAEQPSRRVSAADARVLESEWCEAGTTNKDLENGQNMGPVKFYGSLRGENMK